MNVWYIRSSSFPTLVKVCASDCSVGDILSAHVQVYGSAEVEPAGSIAETEGLPRFIPKGDRLTHLPLPREKEEHPQLYIPRQYVWNISGAEDNVTASNTSSSELTTFFKLSTIIELQWRETVTVEQYSRYIVDNQQRTYDMGLFSGMFPEFEFTRHDHFPDDPLAYRMFAYLLEQAKPPVSNPVVSACIQKVQAFFDVQPSSNLATLAPNVKVTNIECLKTKRLIVRQFVAFQCQEARGHRVRSSELFKRFEKFYNETGYSAPFASMFTISVFSPLMKTNSVFRTKRRSDGIYWEDLLVLDIPVSQTAAPFMGYTFVDFATNGTGKTQSISDLFAR